MFWSNARLNMPSTCTSFGCEGCENAASSKVLRVEISGPARPHASLRAYMASSRCCLMPPDATCALRCPH